MTDYENNEEIKIFREYLRIPTVHPDIDYGNIFIILYLLNHPLIDSGTSIVHSFIVLYHFTIKILKYVIPVVRVCLYFYIKKFFEFT